MKIQLLNEIATLNKLKIEEEQACQRIIPLQNQQRQQQKKV